MKYIRPVHVWFCQHRTVSGGSICTESCFDECNNLKLSVQFAKNWSDFSLCAQHEAVVQTTTVPDIHGQIIANGPMPDASEFEFALFHVPSDAVVAIPKVWEIQGIRGAFLVRETFTLAVPRTHSRDTFDGHVQGPVFVENNTGCEPSIFPDVLPRKRRHMS